MSRPRPDHRNSEPRGLRFAGPIAERLSPPATSASAHAADRPEPICRICFWAPILGCECPPYTGANHRRQWHVDALSSRISRGRIINAKSVPFSSDTAGIMLRIPEALNAGQHLEGVVMKVVTLKDIPNAPMEGAERIEGWTGLFPGHARPSFSPGTPRTITAAS